ncbi:hypothetical protein HY78_12540 [Rhizorhabdus wittichii DC-6]|nr:hypothetical protein HY78_12540 [Rhizorhabdus wittichii DC-6]
MPAAPLIRYRCVLLRRSGASEIRIVRAEDAAAACARLAAAGLDPVSVEPIGPSLLDRLGDRIARGGWRLPRWRRRCRPASRFRRGGCARSRCSRSPPFH